MKVVQNRFIPFKGYKYINLFGIIFTSDQYHDISFEEEAHNNDTNLNYCNERKHYAWFKYLKIKSNKED